MIEQRGKHSPLYRVAEDIAFTYRGLRRQRATEQYETSQAKVWDALTDRANDVPRGENLGRYVSRVREITTYADNKSTEDLTLRPRAERLFAGVELPDSRGFLADILIARAGNDTGKLKELSLDIKREVGFTRLRKPALEGLVMDVFNGTIRTPERKQEPLKIAA